VLGAIALAFSLRFDSFSLVGGDGVPWFIRNEKVGKTHVWIRKTAHAFRRFTHSLAFSGTHLPSLLSLLFASYELLLRMYRFSNELLCREVSMPNISVRGRAGYNDRGKQRTVGRR
jgi:hypothetical protein